MTGDELEVLKAGTEAAVEAAFKPYANLIEKLLVPIAEEAGDTFRNLVAVTIGDRLRFYRAGQQLKFWKKFSQMTEEAGINPGPVPPRLLVDIVNEASLEDNDDLQARYAALLANASNPSSEIAVETIFPRILRGLSSEEAKILDKIYDGLQKHSDVRNVEAFPSDTALGDADHLRAWYCQEFHGIKAYDSQPMELKRRFLVILDHLKGENLLEERPYLKFDIPSSVPESFRFADAETAARSQSAYNLQIKEILARLKDHQVFLTEFGYNFVRACRRPIPKQFSDGNKPNA